MHTFLIHTSLVVVLSISQMNDHAYFCDLVDSGQLILGRQKFVITKETKSSCIDIAIVDDLVAESTKYVNLTLVQGPFPVVFQNEVITIELKDNDGMFIFVIFL